MTIFGKFEFVLCVVPGATRVEDRNDMSESSAPTPLFSLTREHSASWFDWWYVHR